jgi:hypothetical protein
MNIYKCSVCGKPVVVTKDKSVKTCNHVAAPIIANLSATVYGQGLMK